MLNEWYKTPAAPALYTRVVRTLVQRVTLSFRVVLELDVINRVSELARIYGIEFFNVVSRGSQYRVESMMLRIAKPSGYIPLSPSRSQVADQAAIEVIPLVMEPKSGLKTDPVCVLDFRSLYPSIIIAYNMWY